MSSACMWAESALSTSALTGRNRMATRWRRLPAWITKHRVELSLCFRLTVSAVLSLAISHLLNLSFPLWAVLTAVVLTQMSVGQSLKATIDYLASTLGGAVYAAAIGTLMPQTHEIYVLAALALAVAPVALIAATNPRFRAAPVAAVMVFMAPTITHVGPIASAFERLLEVAIGAIVGLTVSFLILPARAHELLIQAAARLLELMARALPQLFAGTRQGLDEAALREIHDGIGAELARLNATALEAKQEQITRFAALPDPGALLRTLLRLRHDLVMIGRATVVPPTVVPLPERFRVRLRQLLERVGETAGTYLHASGAALMTRRDPAPMGEFETALDAYASEVAALRRDGVTRDLTSEALEQLFALGFALEQLHQHFTDLGRCVTEFSQSPARVP
jgi:uncharacterized membrane protein YccC